MEKNLKKVKVFIIILVVILISIIAFWGVFKKEKGIWKNLIPNYQYGMDIEGSRELRYAVDSSEEEKYVYVDENGNVMGEVWKDGNPTTAEETSANEEGQEVEETTEEKSEENIEEVPYAKETRTIKVNPDDNLTKENFEKAKKIIQERLKAQKVSEYNIRIDDVTGSLVVETNNDNDNIELVEDLVSKQGKFQIKDYQNGLVLMDNSDIKKASVVSSNDSGYKTYLQIEFNKEGSEKLREISKKYVEVKDETENVEDEAKDSTEETTEETPENTEEETTKTYVSIVFDEENMMTTYFGEEMTAGILQIPVGEEREEYEEFKEDYQSAQEIADVLNIGISPVKYELKTDNFVKSEINWDTIKTIAIAGIIAVVIISLIFIVRFKKNGILASILGIGYIAVLSLVIRYTNVTITSNSLVVVAIMIILNYIFMNMLLNKMQDEDLHAYSKAMKEFYLKTIPIIILAIVFTLTTNLSINSIGMVLFWGIILNALYNFIFTRIVFKKQN